MKITRNILLGIIICSICSCTSSFEPSGIQTTSGEWLQGPTSKEEAQLVDNELSTQRSIRRSGHGFDYKTDEGRKRYYRYWYWY